MSKIAHYLQEHLIGEVMTSPDARRYFATDASIFTTTPALVVYPRNENDIRKTARFTWQLAERGRVIPMTARGSGTDYNGAALGTGIMLAFPAHMNRVLELDTKSGAITVEPGINYGKMQQTLHTHNRFLPPYPASFEYSTVGGAVANNASGEKSVKYGDTNEFVSSLRVVLANGEVIVTGRLSKREFNKKLGLATFEGEIYRSIDTLLEENRTVIDTMLRNVTRSTAGYNLLDIKRRDGSFDLTSIFVGSQGTLGIITEIKLETEVLNPETTLMMASFDSIQHASETIMELRNLSSMPSAIEMVDKGLLETVQRLNPNQLKGMFEAPLPAAVLFVEFDAANERQQKKLVKQAHKIFERYAVSLQTETELEAQQQLWKVRQASSVVMSSVDGAARAVPVIEGAIVPVERIREYLEAVYALFDKLGQKPAMWGHAGDGSFHIEPILNLSQVGDRQKAFKLMDEYYAMVMHLGGSISGEHNDGRLHAPYLEAMFGSEGYSVLKKVKTIFDPYSILNPGVKFGSTTEDNKAILRSEYGLGHFYNHMPRS
jgi:FAD/FMN-containing dehydrogenase